MPVTRNSGWPGKNHPALGGSSGARESWGAGGAGLPPVADAGADLLGQITRFMQRHGLSDWDYGQLIKDQCFLVRLRGGSCPRASNIARQRAVMAAYDRKSRA